MMKTAPLAILFAMTALAGCGGGGGGGDHNAPAAARLEGAFQGTTGNGRAVNSLTLENGDSWILYGTQVGNAIAVTGMVHATQGASDGTSYTAQTKDYWNDGQVHAGSLSGSYVLGQRFGGTITSASVTTTFTAAPVPTADYNYQTPASVSRIAGTWAGSILSGESGQISIDTGGALQGSFDGCTVTGQVQPRASGKNVFDVSVDFGPAPCELAGQRATGIAVSYGLAAGGTQLIVTGVTANGAAGTAFLATR
ncbi:hypothetical protein [Oryzisolibacter sp. LB2S]|uniref:hypothetical protein n=1 Tax=Alicycliphilus soli TaxID=3228789 RepID=UPI003457F541